MWSKKSRLTGVTVMKSQPIPPDKNSMLYLLPKRITIISLIVLVSVTTYIISDPSIYFNAENAWSEKRSITVDPSYLKDPSHVSVCRAVRDHIKDDGPTDNQRNEKSSTTYLIEERLEVCNDLDNVTRSLSQIFLSAFLASQAAVYGIDVRYSHNCNKAPTLESFLLDNTNDLSTIQQALPVNLEIPQNNENISWESLRTGCQNILSDFEGNNFNANPVNAFFAFDQTNTAEPRMTISQVFLNTKLWDDEVLSKGRKTLIEYALPFIESNFQKAFDTVLYPLENTASIFLPCQDEFCNDVFLLPYYVYPSHIPSSVKNLKIVLQKNCVQKNPNCTGHAQDLSKFLQGLFPAMNIEIVVDNPSSFQLMKLLSVSDYVICVPGYGEVCLFPSITKIPATEEKYHVSRFMIFKQNTLSLGSTEQVTEPDILSTDIPMNYLSYKGFAHINLLEYPQGATFLSSLPNFGDMFSSLRLAPSKETGECRHVRGRMGFWQKDMKYASIAQYDEAIRHYSGQTDKHYRRAYQRGQTELQYRPSTTYRWQDTALSNLNQSQTGSCELNLLTLDSMCSVLQSLDIRRIFFLGDSLTLQQTQSLWKLLSQKNGPTKPRTTVPNFKHRIDCPGLVDPKGEPFFFILQFVRNDELIENSKELSIENGIKNCNEYCYPWREDYYAHPNMRTLMIVNTGAHFHDFEKYKATIDGFLPKIDEIYSRKPEGRRSDIIMFRTTVPGHWGCEKLGLTPFINYEQYHSSISSDTAHKDIYGWNDFFEYNDYVIRIFESLRHKFSSEKLDNYHQLEVLDVLPMTILRQDGHVGDEFKPPNIPDGDCLHYSLPGPIDWWNHLLLSNLLDIASAERKKSA